ncbi:hypothetical protein KAR52_01975 [Candidatus Pacearchaeota archaeon]|nr:hypothetical protein [Candidatus Pacearchaeota archaeon]
MVNIKSELLTHQIILLAIPSLIYGEQSMKLLETLSGERVVYVTLNKTFQAVEEKLKKQGIDTTNITYIDTISKTIKDVKEKQTKKCYYLESISGLEELSNVIKEFLKQGEFYLIFDSVTDLLIHNNPGRATKFIRETNADIRKTNSRGIYYALSGAITDSLIQHISKNVDKTIRIKSNIGL